MEENAFSSNAGNGAPKRYRSFRCPVCRTDLYVTQDQVGTTIECPDCDSEVVVPSYLDFETETDYERQNYNAEKQQRDLLYSPIRNPNREGIPTNESNLYDVAAPKTSMESDAESAQNEALYIPIRCRVCETFMQVPRELLGKEVECPDCGTKTVVTDALLNQQRSIEVKFQPRKQEAYEVGAVPDAPAEWFQLNDGRMLKVNRESKEIAPEWKPKDRHFDPSAKRKRRSEVDKIPTAATALEQAFQIAPRSKMAEDYERQAKEKLLREENARGIERAFVAIKRFLRLRSSKLSANPESCLPPLVLRMKNGEYVWTKASPPMKRPLFNGTFRPLFSEELIAHVIAMAIILLLVAFFLIYLMFPVMEAAKNPRDAVSRLELLVYWILTPPCFCFITGFIGLTFWSVFHAGYEGASIVPYWRSESVLAMLGYGLWFTLTLLTTGATGALLAGATIRLWDDPTSTLTPTLVASAITTCFFWFFFPIVWLSTIQSEMFFAPITKRIVSSFATQKARWAQLYIFEATFFVAPTFVWTSTAGTNLFWFLIPVVVPYFVAVCGLLLGRMAWILDDETASAEFDD